MRSDYPDVALRLSCRDSIHMRQEGPTLGGLRQPSGGLAESLRDREFG